MHRGFAAHGPCMELLAPFVDQPLRVHQEWWGMLGGNATRLARSHRLHAKVRDKTSIA